MPDDPVELFEPVYGTDVDDTGAPVVRDQRWVGLLIPEASVSSRQEAVEALQRYAVEVRGWDAYPGSVGATGPYEYAHRHGLIVRAVRWAPGDLRAGRYWRVMLGAGMDEMARDVPIVFDADEPDGPVGSA